MNDLSTGIMPPTGAIVGESARHESAHLHVSGRAIYADDFALPANTLHAVFGISRIAHGRVKSLDLSGVLAAAGVVAVALAADVPGENNYGGIVHDDPIFAEQLVQYAGQPLFAVAATSYGAARRAAAKARVEYEELPAILTIREALAAESYVIPSQLVVRGRARDELAKAPRRLQGTMTVGGQDHFYLEGQIAIALPRRNAVHQKRRSPTKAERGKCASTNSRSSSGGNIGGASWRRPP